MTDNTPENKKQRGIISNAVLVFVLITVVSYFSWPYFDGVSVLLLFIFFSHASMITGIICLSKKIKPKWKAVIGTAVGGLAVLHIYSYALLVCLMEGPAFLFRGWHL